MGLDLQAGKGQMHGLNSWLVSMKAVKHRWTFVADPVHLVFCRAEELSNNVNTSVLTVLILITCFLLQSQCFKLFTNL